MQRNIGTSGRFFRLSLAILLYLCALWMHSLIVLLFSFFVFFEAIIGWCLVYQILGKSSCPIDSKK